MRMNCLHAFLKALGVLFFPIPYTGSPCSRMRLARRVKSLSYDTSTNPSKRPAYSKSIASMTSAMSAEFFPWV